MRYMFKRLTSLLVRSKNYCYNKYFSIRDLYSPLSEKEIDEVIEREMEQNFYGGGLGIDDIPEPGDDSDNEKSDIWHTTLEHNVQKNNEEIKENWKITEENRKRVIRIDERTAWQTKIITGVFLAVAAMMIFEFINSGGI